MEELFESEQYFIFVIPFGVVSGAECNVSETLALIFIDMKRENICSMNNSYPGRSCSAE